MLKKIMFTMAASLGGVFIAISPVSAHHSWGPYHWARTTESFTLMLGDNVSSTWDPFLVTASDKWSESTVLDTVIVGGSTTGKRCRATQGRVEVCNSTYGRNGWLGLATISVSGSHITQGTVKLNDTYFNTSPYNTSAWRNLVMCQEVGHTFGLDHQDENNTNTPLGSCMDYSSNPGPNQYPNPHDYEELEAIYAHLDLTTTVSQPTNGISGQVLAGEPGDWGRLVKQQGRTAVYERDLGHGRKVITFVIFA